MAGEETIEERLKREPKWMELPFVMRLLRHGPALLLCLFIFALYGLFLSHPIDLTTADLGRHIKNGEVLFQDSGVLRRNFYSYTEPDFPVINHHWGSGLLLYAAHEGFGFTGVHLLFILLSFAALCVFLKTARLYAPWGIVGFAALPATFLLAERTEIRPEVFSYLFAGFFFYILCHSSLHWNDRPRGRTLWLLPFIEILWVNTHIYFLLGPLIIGAFLLEALLKRRREILELLGVCGATLLATLVNPFGYKALTGALTLFENFGYRLAENQSLFFLKRLGMSDPNFLIFQFTIAAAAVLIVSVLYTRWRAVRWADTFVFAGISLLAVRAVRNFALFGLFAIPFIAGNARLLLAEKKVGGWLTQAALFGSAAVFLATVLSGFPRYFPYWRSFGYGLQSGNSAAAEFLRANGISGPYFNNYDIGGYLIFHLFPKEKVFVDNRPEAYSTDFFRKTYVPMQEDDGVWKQELQRHNFNAIVFSHRDATPWGQKFLVARLADPEWAPVYVDERVLVLLRRAEGNTPLIEKFLLPPETFRISR